MTPNYILWFMKAIASFGGEYIPFRDFGTPKQHTSGRRETRIEPRFFLSSADYEFDAHGSVRRTTLKNTKANRERARA